jgi:acetyl-CoA carboxylase biotin carboxylase subunit
LIKRLLIANRGEIAVRIIRTCREMGITTVAAYSTVDKESLPVRMADQAVCIGPPPVSQSYLARNNLIMAAITTGCEAIHPGTGFLAEDPAFARAVQDRGLIFIGPGAEALEHTGDKSRLRKTAAALGLPLIPGGGETAADRGPVKKAAADRGFPVIVKAAGGLTWLARSARELEKKLSAAKQDGGAEFAGAPVFVEPYLDNPRLVEVQIIADGAGKVAVLGERDSSIRRRRRKLIEESPSPGVSGAMRKAMSEGAAKLFRGLRYRGVGTAAFLVFGEQFFFLDVKPRLQSGHPVHELVTGADILRQQLLTAVEGRMEMLPSSLRISGWAMECRINALDAGRVTRLEIPGGPGVRFDSCLYGGCTVASPYDSLVGKVIVHGPNRNRALARMDRALEELTIRGISTDLSMQQAIIRNETFRSGAFGTCFYDEFARKKAP